MPLTVTLQCAFCERRTLDPGNAPAVFDGWYAITPVEPWPRQRVLVCSETCGASWFMRRELEREQEQKTREAWIAAMRLPTAWGSTSGKHPLEAGSWGNTGGSREAKA